MVLSVEEKRARNTRFQREKRKRKREEEVTEDQQLPLDSITEYRKNTDYQRKNRKRKREKEAMGDQQLPLDPTTLQIAPDTGNINKHSDDATLCMRRVPDLQQASGHPLSLDREEILTTNSLSSFSPGLSVFPDIHLSKGHSTPDMVFSGSFQRPVRTCECNFHERQIVPPLEGNTMNAPYPVNSSTGKLSSYEKKAIF